MSDEASAWRAFFAVMFSDHVYSDAHVQWRQIYIQAVQQAYANNRAFVPDDASITRVHMDVMPQQFASAAATQSQTQTAPPAQILTSLQLAAANAAAENPGHMSRMSSDDEIPVATAVPTPTPEEVPPTPTVVPSDDEQAPAPAPPPEQAPNAVNAAPGPPGSAEQTPNAADAVSGFAKQAADAIDAVSSSEKQAPDAVDDSTMH